MKGKGKGSGSSSSSTTSEECPLQFPDVSPLDHVAECPRYTAVAQGDAPPTLEDVDALQLELETLLVSVCARKRQLAHETQVLVSWQEKKIPLPSCTPGKRQRASPEGKPCSKKFKDGGKVFTGGRPPRKHIGVPSAPSSVLHHEEGASHSAPRNDAPNRFWALLEPYCAEITADDLRTLEELVRNREDDAEYYRIPALGRHYAHRWAQEDLLEEQNEGSKASAVGDGADSKTTRRLTDGKDAERMLKGAAKELEPSDACPLGPLTQRLVSCLVEENLMCSVEDADVGGTAPLAVAGAAQLERRVRRELQEQGLLEEAAPGDGADDQVLAELRRCQAELRALSAHNSAQLATLVRRARDRLAEQELRRKLRIADNEVLDVFRRITSTRQRKKSPTKKDRDQALRALRERQALVRQVDRLTVGGGKH